MGMSMEFDELQRDFIEQKGLSAFLDAPILGVVIGEQAVADDKMYERTRARMSDDVMRMLRWSIETNQKKPVLLLHRSAMLNTLIAAASSLGCVTVQADELTTEPIAMVVKESQLVLSYGTGLRAKNMMERLRPDPGVADSRILVQENPYSNFQKVSKGLQQWTREPFPVQVIRVLQILDNRPR